MSLFDQIIKGYLKNFVGKVVVLVAVLHKHNVFALRFRIVIELDHILVVELGMNDTLPLREILRNFIQQPVLLDHFLNDVL